jgi:5-methylcytosine-specific restriction endonuclease McrA
LCPSTKVQGQGAGDGERAEREGKVISWGCLLVGLQGEGEGKEKRRRRKRVFGRNSFENLKCSKFGLSGVVIGSEVVYKW